MTVLAHNCAVLGLSVDTWQLFTGDNPFYEMWLDIVSERVSDTNRKNAPKKTK